MDSFKNQNLYVWLIPFNKKKTEFQTQAACKEGCRLQVIFAFSSNSDVISAREDCYNGCAKSYSDDVEKQACSFGCDKQPDMKKSRVSCILLYYIVKIGCVI